MEMETDVEESSAEGRGKKCISVLFSRFVVASWNMERKVQSVQTAIAAPVTKY